MAQVQSKTPQVGDQAPNLVLNDTTMQPVSLEQFRGTRVVLVFYPAAFSGVCTKELCAFRDHMADLNSADAQVIAVSVDLPYTLKEFKKAQQLDFPVLSDFDHVAIEAYGVVDSDFNGYTSGVARRSVFVIDPSGTITWEWLADSPGQQPDYSEVLEHVGVV
jgi:peroxiredoxin